MPIFKEIPPTAGFPLRLADFLTPSSPESLQEDFKKYLGLDYARVAYSGTAAFYFILESLKKISAKRTVVIPSFVCPLVSLAIARAGLKVAVCDIRPGSFDYDDAGLEKVCAASRDILAITAVHLAGIPLEFVSLKTVASKHGAFIVEDCAQSLGADYGGRKTGTLGDFSFYSLCRGKGLTIYEGGVITTGRQEYRGFIDETIGALAGEKPFSEALKIFEIFGYWVFYRPALFWFVFSLPQLFWDWRGNSLRGVNEYFDVNFPLHRVGSFRQSIGHAQFPRLEREIEKHRQNAAFYLEALSDLPGIKIIKEAAGTKSNYPYLTLVVDDPLRRRRLLKDLKWLGASQIYASAITEYDYLQGIVPAGDCPSGRHLAAHHLTLSTSSFLQKQDLIRVVNAIKM